jgi:hypothetical protein
VWVLSTTPSMRRVRAREYMECVGISWRRRNFQPLPLCYQVDHEAGDEVDEDKYAEEVGEGRSLLEGIPTHEWLGRAIECADHDEDE